MKKKVLSLFMTAVLTIAMTVPTFAGTWSDMKNANGTDYTGSETQPSSTGPYGGTFTYDGSGSDSSTGYTRVTAFLGSSYSVVVPATLALTKVASPENNTYNYEGNFDLYCYGSLLPTEKIEVEFGYPSGGGMARDKFLLSATGVDPVQGVVTMPKTIFKKTVESGEESSKVEIAPDLTTAQSTSDARGNSPVNLRALLNDAGVYEGALNIYFTKSTI